VRSCVNKNVTYDTYSPSYDVMYSDRQIPKFRSTVKFPSSGKEQVNLKTALFRVISQRVVVIPYRRFRTTYRSYLQGSRIFYYLSFKMLPTSCPETLVRNYHHSLRNNSEERSFRLTRGGCLKRGELTLS